MDKSIITTGSIYTIIVCMVMLAGCAKQLQVEPIERVCAAGLSKAEAMNAAESVLGEIRFSIEKVDAEAGLIRTRPLAAGQWFEFWREDNVGEFNKAEANLHTIRRTAEIKISQKDTEVCVDCEVKTQRLSLSDRNVHSATGAQDLFTENKGAFQRLELNRDQKKSWIDLGEDEQLSSLILRRIEENLKAGE